jgi:hypothetical protein
MAAWIDTQGWSKGRPIAHQRLNPESTGYADIPEL